MSKASTKMNRYVFVVVIFLVAILPFCEYKTVFPPDNKWAKQLQKYDNCSLLRDLEKRYLKR